MVLECTVCQALVEVKHVSGYTFIGDKPPQNLSRCGRVSSVPTPCSRFRTTSETWLWAKSGISR